MKHDNLPNANTVEQVHLTDRVAQIMTVPTLGTTRLRDLGGAGFAMPPYVATTCPFEAVMSSTMLCSSLLHGRVLQS
jgi:hypothetical protein